MENGLKLISVTDLCGYKFCPRSLYLKLVLGLREPAKPVMVLGGIRHKVFEDANRIEQSLVEGTSPEMTRQEMLAMFQNAYEAVLNKSVYSYSSQLQQLQLAKEEVVEQLKAAVLSQAQGRADEIIAFSAKTRLFGSALWEKLTPKIIAELPVRSERLRLKGIVDRIEVYGKEYIPVEIKTGRVPYSGVWPDHRLQLAAYMLLLNERFNANVKEALVRYVKENQVRQVVMNPFMEYEVTGVRDSVFELMQQKDAPKVCGKDYCTVCSYGDDFERHLLKRKVYA